jgi:hypothetical protein
VTLSPATGTVYVAPVTGATMRLRVSAFTSGTVTVVATLKTGAPPLPNIQSVQIGLNGNYANISTSATDAQSNSQNAIVVQSRGYGFNGTTWDRQYNNLDTAALVTASAASAGTTSADQVNFNAVCAIVGVNITTMTGTAPTLTVTVQGKDAASGVYYTLLASAALSATGFTPLTVCPGSAATANTVSQLPLPRTWRISTVIGGTTPAVTYTVGASVINK